MEKNVGRKIKTESGVLALVDKHPLTLCMMGSLKQSGGCMSHLVDHITELLSAKNFPPIEQNSTSNVDYQ